jgi:hypothetical protein
VGRGGARERVLVGLFSGLLDPVGEVGEGVVSRGVCFVIVRDEAKLGSREGEVRR